MRRVLAILLVVGLIGIVITLVGHPRCAAGERWDFHFRMCVLKCPPMGCV